MSANDNKIVPSDQSRPPASEDHDTRVATRAYAVRHGDTTLEHLSSERGLDYDEVLRLNPAVSARNGLLKAGDVLKLPKQGASGPKRCRKYSWRSRLGYAAREMRTASIMPAQRSWSVTSASSKALATLCGLGLTHRM